MASEGGVDGAITKPGYEAEAYGGKYGYEGAAEGGYGPHTPGIVTQGRAHLSLCLISDVNFALSRCRHHLVDCELIGVRLERHASELSAYSREGGLTKLERGQTPLRAPCPRTASGRRPYFLIGSSLSAGFIWPACVYDFSTHTACSLIPQDFCLEMVQHVDAHRFPARHHHS